MAYTWFSPPPLFVRVICVELVVHDQLKYWTVRVLEHPTYGVNTCGELSHPK